MIFSFPKSENEFSFKWARFRVGTEEEVRKVQIRPISGANTIKQNFARNNLLMRYYNLHFSK
jgi:hypothetical protein